MTNRLQKISDSSTIDVRRLGAAIRTGEQAPLFADEYAAILERLQAPETSYEMRRSLLALALVDRGSNDALTAYCKTWLATTATSAGFSGYEGGVNLALQIVLAKSVDSGVWVKRFEQSKAAVLRLIVAEHVAGSDLQQGLMMMIDTLPLAGTDHAVSDAIDLWLSNEGNPALRAAVESRLNALTKTPANAALIAALEHARDVIANA
jgi:hypothetical protein